MPHRPAYFKGNVLICKQARFGKIGFLFFGVLTLLLDLINLYTITNHKALLLGLHFYEIFKKPIISSNEHFKENIHYLPLVLLHRNLFI